MKRTFINDESSELVDISVMNSVTIDCVIFGFERGGLEVLLVKHSNGISKGKWSLPRGWIKKEEGIDVGAHRLLRELKD